MIEILSILKLYRIIKSAWLISLNIMLSRSIHIHYEIPPAVHLRIYKLCTFSMKRKRIAEAKELMCTTHGRELRLGECWVVGGVQGGGG